MGNYKIRLNLGITNLTNNSNKTDIDIETELTEEEACSIDFVEKAMLKINYEAIRKAVSEHFENLSKKKPKLSNAELEEELMKIIKNTVLMEK